MSLFKVEHMMFLNLDQGCLPEVQKYNAVIAAQQERRSQRVQDVQLAQEAAAGGDNQCRNIEKLVRSGEYVVPIKFDAWEMSPFGKKAAVECKPDRATESQT